MKLEFSYRDHDITLLSSPLEQGWAASCQVHVRVGDQDFVHTLGDPAPMTYATLEEANRHATELAKKWVDDKIEENSATANRTPLPDSPSPS